MKSPVRRHEALQAAMDSLKTAAERDLGRAVRQRHDLLAQLAELQGALQNQSLFGDLVLVAAIRQIKSLAGKIQETEATIGKLRKRAVDCLLKAKRVGGVAERARRDLLLKSARTELAELTDQQAGRRRASLPQAIRS